MILSKTELALIAPALALVGADETAVNIDIRITDPKTKRDVRVGICASGVTVKSVPADTAPVVEHFRSPMGMALAYKVPLVVITNQSEGD